MADRVSCAWCGSEPKASECQLAGVTQKWTTWRCPKCGGRNGIFTGRRRTEPKRATEYA